MSFPSRIKYGINSNGNLIDSVSTDCVVTGFPNLSAGLSNLLGLKNNKRNQNMTKLDSTTRTSSGFQHKFGIPIGL